MIPHAVVFEISQIEIKQAQQRRIAAFSILLNDIPELTARKKFRNLADFGLPLKFVAPALQFL